MPRRFGKIFNTKSVLRSTLFIVTGGAATSYYIDSQWRRFDADNKNSNTDPTSPNYLGDNLRGYKTTAYNNPPTVLKEPVTQYPQLSSSHSQVEDGHLPSIADVCIVGAGFAGLHTALTLVEKGTKNVVVLEANRVGSGASGMCGGMAIVGYEAELGILEATVGAENARKIFQQSISGYERLKDVIRKYQINCGLVEAGILEMMLGSRFLPKNATSTSTGTHQKTLLDEELVREEMKETVKECEEEEHAFGQITKVMSLESVAKEKGLVSDRFAYGCFNPRTFSMNPLALAIGLARACTSSGHASIYERSEVISIERESVAEALQRLEKRLQMSRASSSTSPEKNTTQSSKKGKKSANQADHDETRLEEEEEVARVLATIAKYNAGDWVVKTNNGGSLVAKEVLLATNYAPWRLRPKLSMTTTPCSTSIFLTKPLPEVELQKVFSYKGCVIDERFGLVYFRRVDGNRILFGGLASGKPFASNMPRAAESLKKEFVRTFPSLEPYLEVQEHWEGRIEHRDTMFPVVGRDEVDGLWYSLGFSGHGVVPTCTSGEVVGSAIASLASPLSKIKKDTAVFEQYNKVIAELIPKVTASSSSNITEASSLTKNLFASKAHLLLEPTDVRYELWKEISWLASAAKIKSLSSERDNDGGNDAPVFHQHSSAENKIPLVSNYMPPVMPPSGFPFTSIIPYVFVDFCLPLWEWWNGAV